MGSIYQKGTQIWLADSSTSWLSATVQSIALPSDGGSEVIMSVQYDEGGSENTGNRTLKFPAATFLAEAQKAGSGSSSSGLPLPGYDAIPPLRNPPMLESAEDLSALSNLNEPSVLHAIATRYAMHLPYTYSGIVLVALNPFSPISIYGPEIIQAYCGRKKADLEPHLFAIAEEALDCMRRGTGTGGTDPTGAGDQTIVVSGESGAGKTVSAKYILRYFASVDDPSKQAGPHMRRRVEASNEEERMSETEKQILASNPILEAFGNAKTTRNDNSSRFGKYIEILFDDSHSIVGARIRTYLLERSRLVDQPDSERNYHIFYQLLAGSPSKERKDLSLLGSAADFAYLAGGGPSSTPIAGVDDAKEFKETQGALSTVGIAVERQWHIFRLLAALLHLGNIKITQSRTDAVLTDEDTALALATSLLGLPKTEFKKWIIKKQLVTRSEKIVTALSSAAASVVRDSVAKFLYSCLFDWLVGAVNESLAGEGGTAIERSSKFIGVLDIYGFEHFKRNSFEQFCINWANEKLQQEFNAHVFKLEQEEYVREQINWTFIDFADNQACIDVIEGRMGVLSLLDEESRLPAGADASLANKLHAQLSKPDNINVFKKPRFNQNAFTIVHYAHEVTYDVDGFIEKNRDTVPDEHLALLQESENIFLKEVLEAALGAAHQPVSLESRPKKATMRKPTLGSIFKNSLTSLMETINSTNVHYIRCIKPNEAKKAWVFEPDQVLGQLRACGVLETIRISCAGYPSRWTFEEFAERYYMLINSRYWQGNDNARALCAVILKQTLEDQDKYQIGLTKIFFRAGILAILESTRTNRINELVVLVQKNVRRWIAYREFKSKREKAILLQTWWRGIMARKLYLALQKEHAAGLIQTFIRGWMARRSYARSRSLIIQIQSSVRGLQARRQLEQLRIQSAATTLQRLLRSFAARKRYHSEIRRIILLQSLYRRRLAVRELKGLKAEAKSASKFKEISYQLENKVVELTQALQRRTAENKDLSFKLVGLQTQITQLQTKSDEDSARMLQLEDKLAIPTVPIDRMEGVLKSKVDAEDKLRQAVKDMKQKDDERAKMVEEMRVLTDKLLITSDTLNLETSRNNESSGIIANLRLELASLKEQVSRNNALNILTKGHRDPPSPTFANGLRALDGANGSSQYAPPTRRRQRRHSTTGQPPGGHGRTLSQDEVNSIKRNGLSNPRAVSVMFPHENGNLLRSRDSNGLPTVADNTQDEIFRLLGDEVGLDEDVLSGLINDLRIPQPSMHNPPLAKEVIFPAHLISLVSNEMWKLGMISESERFLANVMQSIQAYVMKFKGDDVIQPGIFWLSNVHEILSFIVIAEQDAKQGIAPGSDDDRGRQLDWDLYDHLLEVVKHDLDSLEYNIYHTFMLDVKKVLARMVIPALIESQSLPGFITSDGTGRMFSRMLSSVTQNHTPQFSMDDVLNSLNRVWKCLKSYYVEESVMQQVVTELLKLIGQVAFNDLIMRRNFCSWKRAMQIQYNITRIEEWCKAHEIPEGLLQLEHLMQATKLLQLKKATMGDIEILFDVCWILTPSQIQKLISQYHVADYEAPISSEILKAVAARVKPDDKTDQLLLSPETDEVGPYQIPPPRDIPGLETYVPAWLNTPLIRRLATFVA